MKMSEIKEAVREACEELGYKWNPELIEISINPRLKTAAGRAKWSRSLLGVGHDRIELNPTALKEHPREENINTIRHEVAHLVTRARDSSKEFKRFCKRHGIPLHYAQSLSAAPYQIWCKECGVHGRRYAHMGSRLKRIQRSPNVYRCTRCGTEGSLEVKDVREPAHIMEVARKEGRAEGNAYLLTRGEKFLLEGQGFTAAQVGGDKVIFDRKVGDNGALVLGKRRMRRTKKPKGKGG